MSTTFMGLTLPEVGVTIGDTWATQLNAAITLIDSHDHTSGSGQLIPVAGLNINDNLDLAQNDLENIGESAYYSTANDSSNNSSVYVKNGDLHFKDSGGNVIQLTSGGAVNVGSTGNITGLTGSATVYYSPDPSFTYFFKDENGASAGLDMGNLNATGTLTVGGAATLSSSLAVTTTISSGTGITATTGDITASTGDIISTIGNVQADNITDAAGTGAPTINGQTILDSTPADPNVRASYKAVITGSGNKETLTLTGHTGQNNLVSIACNYRYTNSNGTTMQTRLVAVIKDTTSGSTLATLANDFMVVPTGYSDRLQGTYTAIVEPPTGTTYTIDVYEENNGGGSYTATQASISMSASPMVL